MSVAFLADRRLYLTADRTRIVEGTSPEAAFLFVGKGHPISPDDAARLGLTLEAGRVVLAGEASPAPPIASSAETFGAAALVDLTAGLGSKPAAEPPPEVPPSAAREPKPKGKAPARRRGSRG